MVAAPFDADQTHPDYIERNLPEPAGGKQPGPPPADLV